jgi:RNA polymerase sigma-70 factor (ECF subfamily)
MLEIDELTIRQAAKKDKRAFGRIYDYYSSFLWKVIYRTVNGDSDAAREIVQETFIRVYSSVGSFAFNSAFSTWLYRIAFNAANTFLSKRNRKRYVISEDMDIFIDKKPKKDYEKEELVNMLLKLISPEDRFLLVSREVEGVPFEELATITGKSSESLRTTVSRLKERLRLAYKQMQKVG